MDNDRLATERVMKARADIILSHVFYGVLVSQVEPMLSRKVPTMATDGKRHYYNPDFVNKLTQKELLAVQRHESEHDARKHHSRRAGRDPDRWNRATDYSINIDLVDEGLELPKFALIDPKYRGMSAEEVYRCLELDEEKNKPQPDQDQGDQDRDNQDRGNQDRGDQDRGDQDRGDQDRGDQDRGDQESKAGNGEPSDEAGEGAGEADGESRDDPSGADENQPYGSSGDPGGMGEVLDAGEDSAELAENEQHWDMVVRQAASLARARGNLPGHVAREIRREGKTKQDWRETLRAWIDQGSRRIETWNRPNRRFIGSGIILPGSQRDGLNKVVMLVDTSGSMDEIALKAVGVEIQAAMDDGAIDEIVVVYGDTRVTRVDEYREGDEVTFDPRGGGGTDLRPLFAWVAENVDDPSLMLVFTDGFIGNPGPEPACPVLWCYTGYPSVVAAMVANPPWGAAAIDVGER